MQQISNICTGSDLHKKTCNSLLIPENDQPQSSISTEEGCQDCVQQNQISWPCFLSVPLWGRYRIFSLYTNWLIYNSKFIMPSQGEEIFLDMFEDEYRSMTVSMLWFDTLPHHSFVNWNMITWACGTNPLLLSPVLLLNCTCACLHLCTCLCCRVNRWMSSIWWWMPQYCFHLLALLWPASTLSRGCPVETWKRHAGCVHMHSS